MKAQPAHGRAPSACRVNVAPSGFSLVELILVVAAISVFALIAVPRFASARARYRVEGAAYRLKADLERAQTFARAASRAVRLDIRPGETTYQLAGLRPIDGAGTDTVVNLSDEPYGVSFVDARLTSGSFIINGFGRLESGGKMLLRAGSDERVVEWRSADAGIVVRMPAYKEFN